MTDPKIKGLAQENPDISKAAQAITTGKSGVTIQNISADLEEGTFHVTIENGKVKSFSDQDDKRYSFGSWTDRTWKEIKVHTKEGDRYTYFTNRPDYEQKEIERRVDGKTVTIPSTKEAIADKFKDEFANALSAHPQMRQKLEELGTALPDGTPVSELPRQQVQSKDHLKMR